MVDENLQRSARGVLVLYFKCACARRATNRVQISIYLKISAVNHITKYLHYILEYYGHTDSLNLRHRSQIHKKIKNKLESELWIRVLDLLTMELVNY